MKLPKFCIIENKQELPMPFVLLTEKPFLIGRIFATYDEDQLSKTLDDIANERIVGVRIPGYSVFVLANGCLAGEWTNERDAKPLLERMGEFYRTERIEPHKNRYKRYIYNPL